MLFFAWQLAPSDYLGKMIALIKDTIGGFLCIGARFMLSGGEASKHRLRV